MRSIAERALTGTPESIHQQSSIYARAGMDTAVSVRVPFPDTDYPALLREMIDSLRSGAGLTNRCTVPLFDRCIGNP